MTNKVIQDKLFLPFSALCNLEIAQLSPDQNREISLCILSLREQRDMPIPQQTSSNSNWLYLFIPYISDTVDYKLRPTP